MSFSLNLISNVINYHELIFLFSRRFNIIIELALNKNNNYYENSRNASLVMLSKSLLEIEYCAARS